MSTETFSRPDGTLGHVFRPGDAGGAWCAYVFGPHGELCAHDREQHPSSVTDQGYADLIGGTWQTETTVATGPGDVRFASEADRKTFKIDDRGDVERLLAALREPDPEPARVKVRPLGPAKPQGRTLLVRAGWLLTCTRCGELPPTGYGFGADGRLMLLSTSVREAERHLDRVHG